MCRSSMPPYAGRGRPRRWCSEQCARRARRRREAEQWAGVSVDELLERAMVSAADLDAARPI